MQHVTHIIAAVALVGLTAGCAGTDGGGWLSEAAKRAGEVGEQTKRSAGKAIDAYCMNVPQLARLELRDQVNAYAERGTVKIECKADVEPGQ